MLGRIGCLMLATSFIVAGSADARDVACGEACDSKMNECVAKCEKPPEGQRGVGDEYEVCSNECAKQVFHPCLDECKFPKPDWATD